MGDVGGAVAATFRRPGDASPRQDLVPAPLPGSGCSCISRLNNSVPKIPLPPLQWSLSSIKDFGCVTEGRDGGGRAPSPSPPIRRAMLRDPRGVLLESV